MSHKHTRSGLQLARLAGVPVRLAWSWWLFALVMTLLFVPIFASLLGPGMTVFAVVLALTLVLGLFGMVFVHEAAHALTARAFGWQVHEIQLNMWGGVTTYSDHGGKGPATPGKSLAVALAGPLSNIVLAVIGEIFAILIEPVAHSGWLATLSFFVYANWLLAFFNLLPGHPLDGGRIVESLVWKITGDRARGLIAAGWAGRIIVMIGAGIILFLWITQQREFGLMFILVIFLVGSMLWQAASSAIVRGRAEIQLAALDLTSIMRPVIAVDTTATVADLLHTLNTHHQPPHPADGKDLAPVGPEYRAPAVLIVLEATANRPWLYGTVDPHVLNLVPHDQRAHLNITAVTSAQPSRATISLDATRDDLMEALEIAQGAPILVINHAGQLSGIIDERSVLRWLEQHQPS